ncbi:hypothetical protein NFI96_019432, partial [Prochilodus magdalenae]
MPGTITGLKGSCLVIPCSFSYDSDPPENPYRVVWYQYVDRGYPLVYDSWYPGDVINKFYGRTRLYRQTYRDCSLLITKLDPSHHGEKLYAWIDPENVGKSTYVFYDVTSTIRVENPIEEVQITPETEFLEGVERDITCSVKYKCPKDRPYITWNDGKLTGTLSFLSGTPQEARSVLKFTAKASDHGRVITCRVEFKGSYKRAQITLKVKRDISLLITVLVCILPVLFATALSDVWKAEVTDKVNALVSSCVVMPCSFNYPGTPLPDSRIRGIWHKKDKKENIYHEDQTEVADSFKERTKLLGRLGEKNCTLEIDRVRDHDNGPFCFRAEIPDLNKYSFVEACVTIFMMPGPEKPMLEQLTYLEVGTPAAFKCSIKHTCPSHPPTITWSHFNSEATWNNRDLLHGNWEVESLLTLIPNEEHDFTDITCNVTFHGGKRSSASITQHVKRKSHPLPTTVTFMVPENGSHKSLVQVSGSEFPGENYRDLILVKCLMSNLKLCIAPGCPALWRFGLRPADPSYDPPTDEFHFGDFVRFKNGETDYVYCVHVDPPVNVEVISGSSVKEGDSAALNCSSDSNPVAHAYQWFTERGTLVSEEHTYTLKNVKRHAESLYCTATNTEGQASSATVQLNVVYPPEIKVGSSCTSEISTVTCLCMVDSHPSSDIKWWASDHSKALNSSSTERHGSLTIATLQGALDYNTVHCHASNSLGNSTMTLRVPHNGKLVYTAITVSAFLVVITGLTVWMVKKSCTSNTAEEPVMHTKTDKNVTSQSDPE